MTIIQAVSDTHLEFDGGIGVNKKDFVLEKTKSDVIVAAGDIFHQNLGIDWAADIATEHKKPVVVVFGNHDYYAIENTATKGIKEIVDTARLQAEAYREKGIPVYFLENETEVINGVRFVGCTLWTGFDNGNQDVIDSAGSDLNDCHQIGVSSSEIFNRHLDSVVYLSRTLSTPFEGETVVVTHHAPSYQSFRKEEYDYEHGELSHYYCSNLEGLIEQHKPSLWIHGHIHEVADYTIDETRVVCNPRGYNYLYNLVPNFESDKTVDI